MGSRYDTAVVTPMYLMAVGIAFKFRLTMRYLPMAALFFVNNIF